MRTTLRDVARQSGYSISTVSKVLNKEPRCFASKQTVATIQSIARELGYRPNYFGVGLRRQRSNVIGIAGSLSVEIACAQICSLVRPLTKYGYTAFLAETFNETQREKETIAELIHKQVDGLVLFTWTESRALKEMAPPDMPCVVVGPTVCAEFPCVVVDRAASTERAVRRLIELGHRGIAFLCQELASNPGKLAGCKSALAAHGLYDSRLIFETGKEPGAVARFVAGNAELFRNVTAVVASNDLVAVEAISGLAKLGLRVPRDCSVVGYDDTQIAQAVTPTLTTVRQPREAVGANAVEMLLKRIDGKPTENVILVPELVERESTGPCRSGCGRAVAKEGGSYA